VLVLASAEGVAGITAGATLVAAIGLALITVYTTNRRLSEERVRQEVDLAGEAERQGAALAHERELADLADLRMLLGEAALALDLARDARDELHVAVMEHGRALSTDVKDRVAELGRTLVALSSRLLVRLGPDDPITARFTEASLAMLTTWRQVTYLIDDTPDSLSVGHAAVRDAGNAFAASSQAFIRAAVRRAGTVTIGGDA
jgi:hypothetical protein